MIPALNRKTTLLLAPASQTNSATRTANLDTMGADYATIVIPLASAINTNAVGPVIKLSESDDTTVTNFATWSSNFNDTQHSIATSHQVVWNVDTRTRKRYIKVTITTATATNDNVTAGVVGITGRLAVASPGTASLVGSTNDTSAVG